MGCEWKPTWKFIRCRKKNPKSFDKHSFRWITQKGGNAVVVGCPVHHYKKGHCNVGMQVQSQVFKATPGNKRKLLRRKK